MTRPVYDIVMFVCWGGGPMGDLFVPSPPESDFLVVMESLQRGLPQDLDIDTLQVCASLLCYVSYILIGKMYIIDV